EMRHSHASNAIPEVGLEQVSKRLGHANATITSSVYSHLTPDADAKTAKAIDAALTRAGAEPALTEQEPLEGTITATPAPATELPPELAAVLTSAIGQALGTLDLAPFLQKAPDRPAT
ncbi:hypothetical protein C1I98_38530, partial [Spongiactinospora gelatinilytica]